MVAEHDQAIVGVGQIRLHPDGTRELASLVVQPSFRGQGAARQLVDALLTDLRGEVYTLIDRRFTRHFEHWGFGEIRPDQLPRSLSRTHRIGRVVTTVASVVRRQRIRIVPLKRPPAAAPTTSDGAQPDRPQSRIA